MVLCCLAVINQTVLAHLVRKEYQMRNDYMPGTSLANVDDRSSQILSQPLVVLRQPS